MRKNAGVIGLVAVVLAFLGISNLPKNAPGGAPASQTEMEAKPKPAAETKGQTEPFPPCGEIKERLQLLVAENPDQKWELPSVCYLDRKRRIDPTVPRLTPADVTFAIATAPNPISTHLPLQFDRSIEIIVQAAQDNNYLYEASWLPWNEPKDYTRYPDQVAAEAVQSMDENQPGVLVLRHSPGQGDNPSHTGDLAVFVVSESPTGGIDQVEFENALAWIEELGGLKTGGELKILGPTFSGSLPSLYRSLHFPILKPLLGKMRINISSGSVSDDPSYDWFSQKMNEKPFNPPLVTFETALEGDCRVVNRFVQYIENQRFNPERVAVLSEDETAFGKRANGKAKDTENGSCKPSGKPIYLYYPRDIATLRSAYEKQSIFNSGTQTSSSPNEPATALRGDLSEPAGSEHDTVRTYGGRLTPLAQESVLRAITDVLKAKDIQFVILKSTNSLDQIFLSQFLRRSFPDARIVIDGADLLFRRGAQGASLRGVMVLSTYPLLTWQQDWTSSATDQSYKSYRVFGQDLAEGLYIAARGLFPDLGPKVRIANYAPPAWARSGEPMYKDDDTRPATWLTVIGHRQFWPVAVLNSFTLKVSEPKSLLASKPEPNDSRNCPSSGCHAVQFLPVEFWILLIVCFFWGFFHNRWCASGSISPVPAPFRLAYFAPVPRAQHSALIAFGSWLVAAASLVVATDSGVFSWELDCWSGVIAFLLLIVFLFAIFGCAKNYELPVMTNVDFKALDSTAARRAATYAAILFFTLFALLQLAIVHNLTLANRFPALWRSINLLSGVSGMLPQLFLIAGMYCWFWFSLRGLALFGDDRPMLPVEADLRLPSDPPDKKPILWVFSREHEDKWASHEALPFGKFYFKWLGIFFPITLVIGTILLRGFRLRTFAEHTFGTYIFIWVSLCISAVLADTAQVSSAWINLRGLLTNLDRLALRRTLDALRGLSWSSVWAMSGDVLKERYSLLSRQIEAMTHLKNRLNEWTAHSVADAEIQAILLWKIDRCQKDKIWKLATWYENLDSEPIHGVTELREVQEEIASIAGLALSKLLIPSWRAEKDSLIFDLTQKVSTEAEKYSGPVISNKVPRRVLAAEEFFVLPYVGFIQNILGRIRTIVLGSLLLFIATTLAVSSYPFDPLPVLGGIFLVVFVISGTTLIVIYAGMHRDATLSYITGTQPGELGWGFWQQLIAYGIGPLLGLLTTLFPSITDFVFSWLQPSTQAIK
jgi:hypothetical protein